MEMYNPAHPGELIQEWLEGLNSNVTALAKHIGVSRVTLSRIIHGHASVTAEMALRLGAAFGDGPKIWMDLQVQYDLWQAKRIKLPKIKLISRPDESRGIPHALVDKQAPHGQH
jgi:addiction module HigA family antidote